MDKKTYWKNFSLGKELNIAGSFIYNGLEMFHHIDSFHNEADTFEILYALSVAIERLLKISVILSDDNSSDQEDLEKSLITHNNPDLVDLLRKNGRVLNLNPIHNSVLQLLNRFYKKHRYGRFGLHSHLSNEHEEFLVFLSDNYDCFSYNPDSSEKNFISPQNNLKLKQQFGKTIGKIVEDLYKVISTEARRLNIYTYEVSYNTPKAFKIFVEKRYDFQDEDILRRELLVYFANVDISVAGEVVKFIKNIDALPFDPEREGDYIRALVSNRGVVDVLEELECLYIDHVANYKDRVDELNSIEFVSMYTGY